MKHIKLFEQHEEHLRFDDHNFFFISGDRLTVSRVLLKLQNVDMFISEEEYKLRTDTNKYNL